MHAKLRVISLCALGAALAIITSCTRGDISELELDAGTTPITSDPRADAGSTGAGSSGALDAGSAHTDAGGGAYTDAGAASSSDASTGTTDAGSGLGDATIAAQDARSDLPDASTSEAAIQDAQPGSPADSGPPEAPSFALVLDTPMSGASVKSPVVVRGRAPGFVNVEVWDAQHTNPPLGRAMPKADGSFEISIDIAALPSGATTWSMHAWDRAAGAAFTHTDSVDLSLTLDTGTKPPDSPAGGTADPGTTYVPAGYKLTFSDEFTSGALDTGKWNTLAPFGVHFFADSKQKQYFVPQAVTLNSGVVRFTAQRSTGNTEGQPYSSGSITTNGTFTHGYFESRVKVPKGKGYWPAYWLTSSTRWPPEWDIFEIIDNVIFGYTHPVSGGKCSFVNGAAGSDSTYQIANLYETWHVYGFLWTASDLYWYVDGVMTEHYSVDAAAGANDPFWLNLSLQVGGDWPGDPDGTTPFPGTMDVDYVRVYQN